MEPKQNTAKQNANTVLVLGYRKAVIDYLNRSGVDYVLWVSKPPAIQRNLRRSQPHTTSNKNSGEATCGQTPARNQTVIIRPFPKCISQENSNLEFLKEYFPSPPSAVLTLTEEAILVAALIRQNYGSSGMGVEASLRCFDKYIMKCHANTYGLAVTPFALANELDLTQRHALLENWGAPLIAKPRIGSGGFKHFRIYHADDFASCSSDDYLIEKEIKGQEFSVETFIADGQIRLVNITEYAELGLMNIVPADFPKAVCDDILRFNNQVLKAFSFIEPQLPPKFNGVVHLEGYLTADGITFGEIAARPPGGYIMNLLTASHTGFNAWEACVDLMLQRAVHWPRSKERLYAGVRLICPPPGKAVSFLDKSQLSKLRQTYRHADISLKLSMNEMVNERVRVGNDWGRIIVTADTKRDVIRELLTIERQLQIVTQPFMSNVL